MARKKVKLAFIENDGARKSSLKKRRQGLLKKVSELSILCGVETCAVVLSPDENEPAFWPASRADVERLLMRYLSIPEMERSRKTVNQEMYLRERNSKLTEQRKKLVQKNNELENHYLMQQIYLYNKTMSELALTEMQSLLSYAEEKITEINRRIEFIEQRDNIPQSGGVPSAVEGPMEEEEEETSPQANIGGDGRGGGGDASSWDNWFLDMMKQSGNVAGSSASKRDFSYPLSYSTGGAGTSSHDITMNMPQVNVGVQSGNRGHGGGPVYGRDNFPVMPYQGYVGDMSGGLPEGFARGDVPGSGIGGAYRYAMVPPYQWEVGGSSGVYGAVFPQSIYRSNSNIINAAMQPQENPGGMNIAQGMVLPVVTGGGSGMGVYQRNDMVGVPSSVPPPGHVDTGTAEYGFGMNQGESGAPSQGGGRGSNGDVVPLGNTGNQSWMPPNNPGADAGGSG